VQVVAGAEFFVQYRHHPLSQSNAFGKAGFGVVFNLGFLLRREVVANVAQDFCEVSGHCARHGQAVHLSLLRAS
jgi:hypothetical protein